MTCQSSPGLRDNPAMTPNLVTTAFTLDGYRITRNLGLVRGIVVRSRSIFGTIGAGLQTIVGGNITLLTELCEKTREHAFELMIEHATQMGANAVIVALAMTRLEARERRNWKYCATERAVIVEEVRA